MSRLNCAADHELAIDTIVEEFGVLERQIASGQRLSKEDVTRLLECLVQLSRLVEARDWHSDEEPLPDWLRPQQDQPDREADQVVATDKRPRAAIADGLSGVLSACRTQIV